MGEARNTAYLNFMLEQSVFGSYQDLTELDNFASNISIDFVIPLELISHWRRCGLIADFMANYEALNFKNKELAVSILSTTINELLENAIKFSSDKNKLVNLSVRSYTNQLIIETVNTTAEKHAKKLHNYLELIQTDSAENLFFKQIEENACKPHTTCSELGLLTLIKDYQAVLGVKIQPKEIDDQQTYDVFVQITLNTKEIENQLNIIDATIKTSRKKTKVKNCRSI
jgi:hypothetical protein